MSEIPPFTVAMIRQMQRTLQASEVDWNQKFGAQTTDGSCVWTNVGRYSDLNPRERAVWKRLRKNRKRVWDMHLGGWTGHSKFADGPRADYERQK